jgi:carboxymethylenebutenolidase
MERIVVTRRIQHHGHLRGVVQSLALGVVWRQTDPMPETVAIQAPDGDLPAIRFAPSSPNGGGVVVVQEIFGVSNYIVGRCQDLADEGYVVYAPVLFARLPETPVLDPSSPDYLTQGMSASRGLDWDTAARDVVAAVATLRAEPGVGKVGLLGFCFGGGLAFNVAALTEVDALVSYYGSALPRLLSLAPQVTAPQLHHWGTEDSFIAGHSQAEARAALAGSPGTVQWEVHEGAGHAFDNNESPFHHAAASAAAWPVTLGFLASHLMGQASSG